MASIPKPLPIFGRTTPDAVLDELSHGKEQKEIAYELGCNAQSLNRALRLEQLRRGARNIAPSAAQP